MGLRFCLGRAGSGKTRWCVDAFVERLREDASPRSHPLFLLLPEQATAQTESLILKQAGIRSIMRGRILSFKRLAQLVLEETGGASRLFLDEIGKQMLLRSLVARRRKDLLVFSGNTRDAGFFQRLSATMKELAQFRHSFDEVEAQYAMLEKSGQGDTLLARKLHDLAILGKDYSHEVSQRFSNPDHFLDELADRMSRSSIFRDAEVWIDGFASFMPQELRVLEQILQSAGMVHVALLLDPAEMEHSSGHSFTNTRLFGQIEETFYKLRGMAVDLDVPISPPVHLPEKAQPTRFSDVPVLERFENALADSAMISLDKSDAEEAASEASEHQAESPALPDNLPPLVFAEAAGRREEVEAVARYIRKFCREEGLRYRDMALIVRNLEAYESPIRNIFNHYGIPFFMDRRKDVAHHPLVEMLRSSVRAVISDWPFEDVAHYLKTDFAPLDRNLADHIENEALARGMHGRNRWLRDDWNVSASSRQKPFDAPEDEDDKKTHWQEIRIRALEPLARLDSAFRGNGGSDKGLPHEISAGAFVDAIERLMLDLGCCEKMESWTEQAREQKRLDDADENSQVWEGVTGLLKELRQTLPDTSLPPDDLAAILETGLQSLSLGLVPPALDQVLVGTVERSRQPELHTAFVLGLNDKVFPAPMGEDVIFSDSEREALLENGNFELAPPSYTRLFRERSLGYIAMTRASRRCWMSWALRDEDGVELRPSPFVRLAMDAARQATEGTDNPVPVLRISRQSLDESIDALELPSQGMEMAIQAARKKISDPHLQKQGLALRLKLHSLPEMEANLEAMLAKYGQNREARLDPEFGRRLVHPHSAKSVSQLETQAACPFRYYCQYALKLKERELFQIRPLEIGNFHHDVLLDIFLTLREKYGEAQNWLKAPGFPEKMLNWGKVRQEDALKALDEAIQKNHSDFLAEGPMHERQVGFLKDRSQRQLADALACFIEQGKIDAFCQVSSEFAFGFDGPDSMPELHVMEKGKTVLRLHGKIDRLDLAAPQGDHLYARIIDFKSSNRKIAFARLEAGLDLQLLVYLAAVLAIEPRRISPAAALYFPLKPVISDGFPDYQQAEETSQKIMKASGAIDADQAELLDSVEPGGSSDFYSMRRTTKGKWHKISDVWDGGVLQKISRIALQKAIRLHEEIQNSVVSVAPYQSGSSSVCAYCPFSDVCRIDMHPENVRYMPALKDDAALAEMLHTYAENPPVFESRIKKG
ncbi:MAG: PD-(D/E)XK nuclease family protein [Candidatus Sumerlaeia bacterium]